MTPHFVRKVCVDMARDIAVGVLVVAGTAGICMAVGSSLHQFINGEHLSLRPVIEFIRWEPDRTLTVPELP